MTRKQAPEKWRRPKLTASVGFSPTFDLVVRLGRRTVAQLAPAELRAVVFHELRHVVRGDISVLMKVARGHLPPGVPRESVREWATALNLLADAYIHGLEWPAPSLPPRLAAVAADLRHAPPTHPARTLPFFAAVRAVLEGGPEMARALFPPDAATFELEEEPEGPPVGGATWDVLPPGALTPTMRRFIEEAQIALEIVDDQRSALPAPDEAPASQDDGGDLWEEVKRAIEGGGAQVERTLIRARTAQRVGDFTQPEPAAVWQPEKSGPAVTLELGAGSGPVERLQRILLAVAQRPEVQARAARGAVRLGERGPSWAREPRGRPDALRGRQRRRLPVVAVAIDCSGSMREAWRPVLAAACAVRRRLEVPVLVWADRAAWVTPGKPPEDVGVGTDLEAALREVKKRAHQLAAVVIVTDGAVALPVKSRKALSVPVFAVLVGGGNGEKAVKAWGISVLPYKLPTL